MPATLDMIYPAFNSNSMELLGHGGGTRSTECPSSMNFISFANSVSK